MSPSTHLSSHIGHWLDLNLDFPYATQRTDEFTLHTASIGGQNNPKLSIIIQAVYEGIYIWKLYTAVYWLDE